VPVTVRSGSPTRIRTERPSGASVTATWLGAPLGDDALMPLMGYSRYCSPLSP
jgi:hypothetical protein